MPTPNPLSLLGFGKKPVPASAPGDAQGQDAGDEQVPAPAFSVVRGNPTDEELAALASLIVALQAQADSQQETASEMWQRRLNNTQRLGMRLRPGPGSWKRARPQ
ncbi:MAG: acyl-CoA carboxylase subunit epsilon [Rothia sp. (in: high G+C Gram-positive bacteria)]|nr:acyl-CoA carboxylase subunit epsilon [Rothia sp. (in: high G+C Gram-positive bacteria)]